MVIHKKDFDVIIVGAGPGGASAAKTAAETGYSTCLLEKRSLKENGRYKACGGAVDWKLIDETNYPEEKISRIIDTMVIHHTDGEQYTKKGKGAVVWRSIFDKFVTDEAVKTGAILKENEPLINIKQLPDRYQITTSKGIYHGKYVICADGMPSRTLRQLNWPRFKETDIILTLTYEMKSSSTTIRRILGSNSIHLFFGIKNLIPVGYAWLFPKTEFITVGWGNLNCLVENAREESKKFLALPIVEEIFENSKRERFKAHLIPVGLRPQLYKDKIFAIGDAGGLVDPISGKGIPYAISSGKIAIKTIKSCENKNTPSKLGEEYERNLEKKFLLKLKAKRIARDRIFQNDETLKQFLALWEKYRSSEIIRRNLF
jgi:geranylgeranyl reductase family protein